MKSWLQESLDLMNNPHTTDLVRRGKCIDIATEFTGYHQEERGVPYYHRFLLNGGTLYASGYRAYIIGLARLGKWDMADEQFKHLKKIADETLELYSANLSYWQEREFQAMELHDDPVDAARAFVEMNDFAPAYHYSGEWKEAFETLNTYLLRKIGDKSLLPHIPKLDFLWPYQISLRVESQARLLEQLYPDFKIPASMQNARDPLNGSAPCPPAAMVHRSHYWRWFIDGRNGPLSLKQSQRAVELAQNGKESRQLLFALHNLAEAGTNVGDYEIVCKANNEALRVANLLGKQTFLVQTAILWGEMHCELGDYAEAAKYFKYVWDFGSYNKLGNFIERGQTGFAMASSFAGTPSDRAEKKLRENLAYTELHAPSNEPLILKEYLDLGMYLSRSGKLDEGLKALERSVKHLTPDQEGPISFFEQGRIHLVKNDVAKAEACFRRGGELSKDSGSVEFQWKWRVGIAECYFRQMRYADARKLVDEALDIIEAQRSNLRDYHNRRTLNNNKFLTFELAIQLALQEGDEEQAFLLAERSRARTLLDALGGDADRKSPSVRPKDAQVLCGDGGLVVYLQRRKDLLAWVITSNKVKLFRLSVNNEELAKTIASLHQAMLFANQNVEELPETLREDARKAADWKSPCQRLYRDLWQPLEQVLVGIKRITIIPHQVLHYVPFQGLLEERGFLIERNDLHYAASVTALAAAQARSYEASNGTLIDLDPIYSSDPGSPFHETESGAIRKLYPDATVLTGPKATLMQFFELAPKADILHISSHGIFNNLLPVDSGLVFAGKDQQDALLTARMVLQFKLKHTRLIVMSACVSSVGGLAGGDEVTGLTRAFQEAGVPNVIGSLWPVDNKATTRLMTIFYGRLKQNSKDPVAALCDAQRQCLKEMNHPAFWAAFQVSGIGALK
ncbi:MAG: CHAT domain-containing protein [Planctomycetota bacterium]|nr:CHAT domain-containing protein [Planctomycetota bacterium]